MNVYLLDVNVLLALVDPMHLHHEAAHRWFAAVGHAAWATCPLTENGVVRIASHPSYPNRPGDALVVLDLLQGVCRHPGHRFWPDDVRLREVLLPGAVLTHAQISDLYLLGLAARHQGRLATFDRHVSAASIARGETALERLEP